MTPTSDSVLASARILKIVIVQPVQAPYWTERLGILARHEDLAVTLLLERDGFPHRPGWTAEPIEGVEVQVLGSPLISTMRHGNDLGYRIEGVRTIPWRLPAALWRLRPDVLVLCNATQSLMAWPLKWFLGFRQVLIVEDTPHFCRNLGRLFNTLRGWAYRRADRWIAMSEDACRYLESIGIRKGIIRSSWSLDMNTFRPRGSENRLQGARDQASTPRTVLFVGAMIPRKGIMPLLDAWADLPAAIRQRTSLLLAGDGDQRRAAAAFVQERGLREVRILGHLPYTEIQSLMSAADLFVLPTLQDLFSLTVLEAMACGCPVITTPFNGARELVEQGQTGWIVDPTEPGALTSTLLHALSENVDLEQMGRCARARVAAMDNMSVMSRLREALLDLVSAKEAAN